jgi:hypothetical protein
MPPSLGRQSSGHFPTAPPKPPPKPTEQPSHLAWESQNTAGLLGAGEHGQAIVAEGQRVGQQPHGFLP